MPYRDKDFETALKKKIRRKRKSEYFANKSCAFCGSTEKLVVHHLFPELKDPYLSKHSHEGVRWNWGDERRTLELIKCLVICRSCHSRFHGMQRLNKWYKEVQGRVNGFSNIS